MPALTNRVLPYLKAALRDAGGPVVKLSPDDSPILEPFVGDLFVAYVVDEEGAFRVVTSGEVRAENVSPLELRRAALANLTATIAGGSLRLATSPDGKIMAVLFDGNFEATLMLFDDLWTHVHDRFGPDVVAVAPARDVLAIAAPSDTSDLRAIVDRVWPNGDHLLTRDVFRRSQGAWSVHPAD